MERIEILLFWAALISYIMGSAFYVYYLISRKDRIGTTATFIVLTGFILQTISIGMRWYVAGYMPMSNWFEFLSAFAWTLVVIYLFVQTVFRIKSIGVFVIPLSWILMLFGVARWSEPRPLEPALQSHWFYFHIISAFIAYAGFAVAFGIAMVYLLQEYNMKHKLTGFLFKRLPSLEILDNLSYRAVVFAFPMLTVAIVTGAVWAEQAWGRYWGWDPKEAASLVTWLIFAAYLHARITAGWRGKRAALLSGIGFLMILFTFFVVNFISRLHGYA